MVEDMYLG